MKSGRSLKGGVREEEEMPFPKDAEVVVKQLGEEVWEVRKPLEYEGKSERFLVPTGMETDFASVPRPLVWFLPRYGSYTMAAILHDFLWRTRAGTGEMDWIDADGLFRRAMRELEVPFLRRWIMWTAVRWAALFKPRGRKGWLREAARVMLFSVVALPFVVPPAAVILVALAAFNLVELVVWIPLRLAASAATRARGAPGPKQVNLPSFEWKTTQ
jgi:hypothetical protein